MATLLKILLVEDDSYFRADIAEKLKPYGSVKQSPNHEDAARRLSEETYDLALIDLNLQGKNAGLDLIRIAVAHKITPIMLTSNADPQVVAQAYEMGCKHYFSKLDVQKDLDRQLGSYLRSLLLQGMRDQISREFITQDERLIGMLDQLRHQNLNRDQKILILGPSGVGKTKIAKLIHAMSEPSMDNFIHLNLTEFPDTLVESILFGHKKGSFTGATEDRVGYLQKADGGTLFLDEIGSISLSLQKKLLKVLEEKEFTPVGGNAPIKSDFRLIAATCEDMPKLIETKKFRLDLYFRLKGVELNLPPLSERREDVPGLIDFFVNQSARKIIFSPSALAALKSYDWHGNVRELEQLVRSYTSGSLGMVSLRDLPPHIQNNQNPFQQENDQKIFTRSVSNYVQKHGLRKFFQVVEQDAFEEIYTKTGGNLTKTQTTLGISKSAAYRILGSIQKVKSPNASQYGEE